MRMRRIGKAATPGALLLALCLFVLAACGSNTTAGASSSGNSATATACAQATRPTISLRTTTGILQSINGQTLVVTDTQGKSVTVTYNSSTKFSQEVKLTPADLKEGSTVRVAVTNSGSTYTAVSVTVSEGTTASRGGGFNGFPGFNGTPGARGGANNPCFTRGRNGGTPGASNANFRGLVGTVRQVNGDILTITDTAGASYTVTLTAQTQIVDTKSATAAALKTGEPLAIVGKPGSQSTVTASTIAILLSLPKRGGQGTATPTA
ncbi:MAG TPA: hypothetical protein VF458_05715 [Ktedonobacteraceae bacterium]